MTFDPTKPVQLRNGGAARILATDFASQEGWTIVVAAKMAGGDEVILHCYADGRVAGNDKPGTEHPADLINIEPSKWLNVYDDGGGLFWRSSRALVDEAAAESAQKGRKRTAVLELRSNGEFIVHKVRA